MEFVQALCDRRDVAVSELLTSANVRLLRRQSPEAFDEFVTKHGWSIV